MKCHLEEFSILSLAAYYHPNQGLRQRLQSKLVRGFKESDLQKIGERLLLQKGSEYEPFSLTMEDISYASFLIAFAFGKFGGQEKVRVLSATSPTRDGGLVIAKNLKTYYLHSYLRTNAGKPLKQPKQGWVVLPQGLGMGKKSVQEIQSFLVSDDQGFLIRIEGAIRNDRDGVSQRYAYSQTARIEGISIPLYELGLSLVDQKSSLVIRSGSPESTIKLLAYMAENRILSLRPSKEDSQFPIIRIRLDCPQEEIVPLKTYSSCVSKDIFWLGGSWDNQCGDLLEFFGIEDDEIGEISRWFPPHRNWIDKIAL